MEPDQPQNDQPQASAYESQPPVTTAPAPLSQPTPPPAPVSTPAPEEGKPGKDLKTIILIVVIAILAIGVGVLGYLVLNQNNSSNNAIKNDVTSTDQKEATKETIKDLEETPEVKDDYMGWKTFPQDAPSLFSREVDLATSFSFTEQIKTEFRFPDGWKQIPIAGDSTCRLVMGRVTEDPYASAGPVDTHGGTMCIGAEYYMQGQTVDTKVASLVANGDFVIEEETTVGGVKAITIARIKNIPPDTGGKIFYTYVQNVRTTGNGGNVGTIVGCAPSGEANEREAFMIDCNKAIDSIKFL